jgi:hypothetical protein
VETNKPGQAPTAAPAPTTEAAPAATTEAVQAAPAPSPTTTQKRTVATAGLDTQAVMVGGGTTGESTSAEEWAFKFKGFFRGPMRLSIDNSKRYSNQMEFHAPPATPDWNYTRWMYTNISPGPWAELMFQYGNQRAMMTTAIASYNITSGGWRELQDQLGIDRAFMTLKFPEALGNRGGLNWDVGVFSNRYGGMGKYDAGAYETYIIARTRIAGETLTADLDLTDDLRLIIEHGIGAKMDQPLQTGEGESDRAAEPVPILDVYDSWKPYPGQKQIGTTLLHHLHVGLQYQNILTATAHYLLAFTKDTRWDARLSPKAEHNLKKNADDRYINQVGSVEIIGVDFKLDGGWMGDGYLGYSRTKGDNVYVVGDAIEHVHSQGGWQLAQYFDDMNDYRAREGDGIVHTLGWQYTFSLAGFLMRPRPFWGQAADITLRTFGMYNKVTGTKHPNTKNMDVSKLKFGAEGIYSPLPLMAMGIRMDLVQPNMEDNTQSFAIFSPKLIFRTEFVTHEQIIIQYSYYNYGSSYTTPTKLADISGNVPQKGSATVMPWPYGTIASPYWDRMPDKHVITIAASMWW